MTFMISNDLVHWDKWVSIDLESAENLKALGLDNAEDMKAAWAPQIIFDPITEKYVIYYSVGFPDRHRIYYSLMDENLNILFPGIFANASVKLRLLCSKLAHISKNGHFSSLCRQKHI